MNIEFPTIVYRDGGVYQRKGGTYRILQVKEQESLSAALADGWVLSVDEIGKPAVVEKSTPQPDIKAPESNEAPTLDELRIKAKELGLPVHHKTGADKLAAMIAEKLSEG